MAKRQFDAEMAAYFTCPKCGSKGAKVERIASTGTGLSKFIDLQHMRHLGVSCLRCGFTEFYDLSVIEGSDTLGDILDILLER